MAPRTLTTLRAGAAFHRGDLTLVPVERSCVTVACRWRRLYAGVTKDVAAIVIVAPDGDRALDVSGEPVDLAKLLARASGLREALEASRRPRSGGDAG